MRNLKPPQRILIVRTDRIGDVVLTTPAIKAIRQFYPGSHISILVTPATFDLVHGNPYLDEVMIDERDNRHKGPVGFGRLVHEIHLKQFNVAVIFHTKRRYNLACLLAGIPCRLGYKNNKFGFLLTHALKDPRSQGEKHEAQYCLDVLKPLGIDQGELGLFVPLQKKAEEWVLPWMQEHNLRSSEFIALHPGASDPTKCWPAANFALLIDRLTERYTSKIVLIGSSSIVPLADDILKLTAHPSQVLNFVGRTSVAQTVSLLRRCRLLISNDSGPVHIAAGLGINVISLFLRNQLGINPLRWRPLGSKSYTLSNKPGEEVQLDAKGQVKAGQPGSIKVDEVLELVEQILRKDSQYEIF